MSETSRFQGYEQDAHSGRPSNDIKPVNIPLPKLRRQRSTTIRTLSGMGFPIVEINAALMETGSDDVLTVLTQVLANKEKAEKIKREKKDIPTFEAPPGMIRQKSKEIMERDAVRKEEDIKSEGKKSERPTVLSLLTGAGLEKYYNSLTEGGVNRPYILAYLADEEKLFSQTVTGAGMSPSDIEKLKSHCTQWKNLELGLKTCKVCWDDILPDIYTLINESDKSTKLKPACGHMFHKECISGYLASKINDGLVLDIECIEPDCKRKITSEEIRSIVDSKLYDKYLHFKQQKELSLDPTVSWCPNPKCANPNRGYTLDVFGLCGRQIAISLFLPTLALFSGESSWRCGCYLIVSAIVHILLRKLGYSRVLASRYVKCGKCDSVICFDCKQDYHSGQSCDDVGDTDLKEWARGRDCTDCTKCGMLIERSGGCNHMTCRKCKHEFCWICGADYKSGHFGGPLSCSQYGGPPKSSSANLRTLQQLSRALAVVFLLTVPSKFPEISGIFAKPVQERWFELSNIWIWIAASLAGSLYFRRKGKHPWPGFRKYHRSKDFIPYLLTGGLVFATIAVLLVHLAIERFFFINTKHSVRSLEILCASLACYNFSVSRSRSSRGKGKMLMVFIALYLWNLIESITQYERMIYYNPLGLALWAADCVVYWILWPLAQIVDFGLSLMIISTVGVSIYSAHIQNNFQNRRPHELVFAGILAILHHAIFVRWGTEHNFSWLGSAAIISTVLLLSVTLPVPHIFSILPRTRVMKTQLIGCTIGFIHSWLRTTDMTLEDAKFWILFTGAAGIALGFTGAYCLHLAFDFHIHYRRPTFIGHKEVIAYFLTYNYILLAVWISSLANMANILIASVMPEVYGQFSAVASYFVAFAFLVMNEETRKIPLRYYNIGCWLPLVIIFVANPDPVLMVANSILAMGGELNKWASNGKVSAFFFNAVCSAAISTAVDLELPTV
ncbi:hypothetical protein AAMO2058_000249300 [Amorphochlora amoebiformis]